MSVQKTMILENELEAIFNYLPKMKYRPESPLEFNVTFSHGDKKEMNAFLATKEAHADSPYPLVWLLYPYEEVHTNKKISVERLTLILAVQTSLDMQNKQRLNETYRRVLMPLLDNIKYCFKYANIVQSHSGEYKVVKFPNFSDEESTSGSSAGAFQWDAIRVITDITIIDTCLKPITFY